MATWQVQDAKARFSELLAKALSEGPQVVTKHGKARVVVVSYDEFRQFFDNRPDFRDYLLGGPHVDEFVVERETDTGRDVEL